MSVESSRRTNKKRVFRAGPSEIGIGIVAVTVFSISILALCSLNKQKKETNTHFISHAAPHSAERFAR